MLYAEADGMGYRTNMDADSLGITKMIGGEWKIPWQHAEVIEEIQAINTTCF